MMPFNIGWPELLIFAVVVLLLFGSRLPSVMRSLGSSLSEFKKGTRDAEQEINDASKRE
jgi:sec-independent protein translocase protein TatA